ncbi:uncharacterized protein [Eurosta solidaginis]|uniref:uncharacterized protein n=1 Tax=Eurosta solidaginis TaxID=178769 RepID=UPI003530A4D7
MSKVVSTKQQLERLISLIEENPVIAKGICTKVQSTKRWEEITAELNCLGPPVRETKKWMKVWADMKSKTKKKMSESMVEYRATGGGPNRLNAYTHAEEAIMGLLQLHTSVDPPGEEHGLNTNEVVECEVSMNEERLDDDNTEPIEDLEVSEHSVAVVEERPWRNTIRRCSRTERLKLLEEQTSDQKRFHKEMLETLKEIKKVQWRLKNMRKEHMC